MPIRFYWDSCCFISRLQRDAARISNLEYITDEAAAGRIQIIKSTMAIAEVCYLNRHADDEQTEKDAELVARFFDNEYITVVQLSRTIAEEAARINRQHGAKPADAIHLATALAADAQIVHTYDNKRLLKLDGKVGNPPLTITTPDSVSQQLKLRIDDG